MGSAPSQESSSHLSSAQGMLFAQRRDSFQRTLSWEELSQTIKSPYPMEKGCPGGFGLAPGWLDALRGTAWP